MLKSDKIEIVLDVDASAFREALKRNKGTIMLKLTMANGSTVEGTAEQIAELLKLDDKLQVKDLEDSLLFYKSESKNQYMPITTMNISHIRHAMLKLYRTWADGLSELWGDELLDQIARGPLDNKQFQGLFKAYTSRHYTEELTES